MATAIIESLFQRSLEDMVKGLRVQMIGETAFLSKALDEVKKEMKSTDINTKSVALQKLTYLNMLQGTDMGWAAFHVVEVMSMQKFSIKKIGYLAASQSFSESTDVLLLITNLLRKDFGGKNEYEASLAIECLSRVATPDLARDLMPELFVMLASGRALVRKKATAALSRVFSQYPDAIRVALKRLIERLSDTEPSVVTAAISVLCDLAVKDPKPFLPLAPELYNLLVRSPNNWLCIKLVKILGVLAPLEPRLGKKIADPICDLMRKSEAKSLLVECIQTVTSGLTEHRGAMTLCVEKLNELMREDDANLKYLCLRALANLMEDHPWAVAANNEAIARCLNHKDPSIQKGARRLFIGMVSESNLMSTVQVLLQYAYTTDAGSCNELLYEILSTCSADHYGLILDFSWYVSVLADMARIPACECGVEIGRQLIDIGFRVKSAGADVSKAGRDLLVDPSLLERASIHGVLSAAAWIAGEYVAYSMNRLELLQALLQPRTSLLPPSVRAVYVQAVFKIFIHSSAAFFSMELTSVSSNPNGTDDQVQFIPEADFNGQNPPTGSEFEQFDNSKAFGMTTAESVFGTGSQSPTESFGLKSEGNLMGGSSELKQNQMKRGHELELEDDGRQREGMVNLGDQERKTSNSLGQEKGSAREEQRFVESLQPIIELVAENMSSMETSSDVEVQERACNLVGLLQVMKDISDFPWSEQKESPEAQDFIRLLEALLEVLTLELCPVSVHAQGRVTAPEGLLLENLDALGPVQTKREHVEDILGRDGREGFPKWERSGFPAQIGTTYPVAESSALLAQHRQRHQNFYLPSEEKPVGDSLHPPPLSSYPDQGVQPTVPLSLGDDPKPTRSKARPVVVKLDDDDDHPNSTSSLKQKKKHLKDEFLSSAIMDVLAGGGARADTSQAVTGDASVRPRLHRSHSKHSSRHSGKGKNVNSQAPLAISSGSSLEPGASSVPSERVGDPSNSDQALRHSKSSSKQRHSKHKKHDVSSNPGAELEPHETISPRSPRGRRPRRPGGDRAASPRKELRDALPAFQFRE